MFVMESVIYCDGCHRFRDACICHPGAEAYYREGTVGKKILEYKPKVINFPVASSEVVPPGDFWILKDKEGKLEAVTFRCPCGCGSECYTPVVPSGQPKVERHWLFDEATTTISPSIRYLSGCKAHFNIENGKTVFHGDSGK